MNKQGRDIIILRDKQIQKKYLCTEEDIQQLREIMNSYKLRHRE